MSREILRSPGAALATARLRRGLSLEQIAQRSRVGLDYLQAIEADDWAALPAMIYARGWIRLFAREVGIDAAPVLELLAAQLEGRDQVEVAVHGRQRRYRSKTARRRFAYGVALGVVLAIALVTVFGTSPGQLEAKEAPQSQRP